MESGFFREIHPHSDYKRNLASRLKDLGEKESNVRRMGN
jgi:hypothetical protein